MPCRSMGLFNTARKSWLFVKVETWQDIWKDFMVRNLPKLEDIIQSLIGIF